MKHILVFILVLTVNAMAEKKAKGMKIGDIDAETDTSITIKKGPIPEATCVSYELVDSTEDLEGDEKYDRGDALKSWKEACQTWKKEIKDTNKQNGNSIVSISCGKSEVSKADGYFRVTSSGKSKIKIRMKEKAVQGN